MKIIIIGAGLGGLTAAFCFARKGHEVNVLEQRKTLSPQGSGLNIRPGASRILHSWGLEEELHAISDSTPNVLLRDLESGEIAMRSVLKNGSDVPDWGTHRTDLIELLWRKAVEVGADIQFERSVQTVKDDVLEPSVVLADGTIFEADVILAADGIRSKTRDQVFGTDIVPDVSDVTCYGFKLSAEQLSSDPETAKRLTDNAAINVWMGRNTFVVGRWNETLRL